MIGKVIEIDAINNVATMRLEAIGTAQVKNIPSYITTGDRIEAKIDADPDLAGKMSGLGPLLFVRKINEGVKND